MPPLGNVVEAKSDLSGYRKFISVTEVLERGLSILPPNVVSENGLAIKDGIIRDTLGARSATGKRLLLQGDAGMSTGILMQSGLVDVAGSAGSNTGVLMKGGTAAQQVVANIDVAPTILEAAGLQAPASMDGMSFLALAEGREIPWRDSLLYEYYWERNFPQTPTVHALRSDRYKFVRCHGVWDIDELYDLAEDPLESNNLIFSQPHQPVVRSMRARLFELLEQSHGMSIPLYPDTGFRADRRHPGRSKAADFPPELTTPGAPGT